MPRQKKPKQLPATFRWNKKLLLPAAGLVIVLAFLVPYARGQAHLKESTQIVSNVSKTLASERITVNTPRAICGLTQEKFGGSRVCSVSVGSTVTDISINEGNRIILLYNEAIEKEGLRLFPDYKLELITEKRNTGWLPFIYKDTNKQCRLTFQYSRDKSSTGTLNVGFDCSY